MRVYIGILILVLDAVTNTSCSIMRERNFVLECRSLEPPLGVVLGEYVTARQSGCAIACIQTKDCHYISVKPDSSGQMNCRLYRPEIACQDPSTDPNAWTTFSMQGTPECDDGWLNFGRSCYKFFVNQMIWTDARIFCASISSTLASISSQQENNFLAAIGNTSGFEDHVIWLGGHDLVTEGQWEWLTGEPFVYYAFPSIEPDGGVEENNLAMWIGGGWFDERPDVTLAFVCEKVCRII